MFRLALTAAVAGALGFTALCSASATPVGPLPKGPVTTINAQAGTLVAVALPHRAGGLVWRLAGGVDPKVLVEVGEADVGPNVVVVFRATGAGRVSLAYGLTKGETTGARASQTYAVTVGAKP